MKGSVMTDSSLWLTVVLPSFFGLVSGTVASLIAPWIHWGIEKRKDTRAMRREFIDSLRQMISIDDFNKGTNWNDFSETIMFSQMKPYLSEAIKKELNPESYNDHKVNGPTIYGQSPIGRDTLRIRVLDEITRVEKKWDLI
ncbi:hypothetical protein HQ585_07995 [candidate division KSB1 bacterium]|nr:hypothetical protein [candidate division KSB1 bacterium]